LVLSPIFAPENEIISMILLTGATGLLGMHVLFDLCQKGLHVRALYRSEDRKTSVKQLFAYYDPQNAARLFEAIEWYQGDIEDVLSIADAFKNIEQVIHCAAKVSFRNDDFRKLVQANRYGTANVVNLALKHKVQWFCHVSSTAAIGKNPGREQLNLSESSKWLQDVPVSGYAMSKHLSEKEVWRGIEEGLPAVLVNPSVIFGPGNWEETSLTIFRAVKRGLKFYAPGANAFVDVRDVSRRILFLMENQVVNERFLTVGENLTFKRMTTVIAERLGQKAPTIAVKSWQMGLAWRMAALFSFITRKPTALTKEAAETAFSYTSYSTKKMDALYTEHYITLEESVDNVVGFEEFTSKKQR
jgi:nucleoside-diphosphate-sugar epimerase